jgi:hypothetical protein
MVVNDSNPILLKIIDKDILKYCHIPVIYPFFLNSSIGLRILCMCLIGSFQLWVVYGFIKIKNLQESEHQKYSGFKQYYALA